jgi:PAS domain S-box-containing protein
VKILDLEGRLQHINDAGMRLLEAGDPADLLNCPIEQLYLGQGSKAAAAAVLAARENQSSRFTGFSRAPSGRAQWWDVVITPIQGVNGAVTQVLAISRDITDRRQEEDFRRVQHGMLVKIAGGSALSDALEDVVRLVEQYSRETLCSVLLVEPDGKTLRHAAAASLPAEYARAIDGAQIGPGVGSCGTATYLKVPVVVSDIASDPLWKDFRDVALPFGLRACWSTPILTSGAQALGSFAIYSTEPREPRPDELRLMENAAYFIGVAIEQHRTQQALRQSEARNRAMLSAIPDKMFLMTGDGVFVDYHGESVAAPQSRPHECLGRNIREILPSPLGEQFADTFARVAQTGQQEKLQYSLSPDSEEQFFEASIVPCEGDKVLCIVRDVTARKRAEGESAIQRQELAHLSRAAVLGELTGALAHELSQPLTAIRVNTSAARLMLQADQLALDEIGETLDDVIADNWRAAAVIERLRALLRKEEAQFHRLDVNEVVNEMIDLAHSEIVSRGVVVKRALNAKAACILGDSVQLQQVVLNLLLNACDAMVAMHENQRRITVTTESDKDYLYLHVADRGVGIPQDQLDNIFEPFVTFREKGLGLGLAISRSIIIAHSGSIKAENNNDDGATILCRFPLASDGDALQTTQ